jgi:hypothetical protein
VLLGRLRHTCEDYYYIELNLREAGREEVDRIHLDQSTFCKHVATKFSYLRDGGFLDAATECLLVTYEGICYMKLVTDVG